MDLTNDDGLSPGISNKRYTFDEANEQFSTIKIGVLCFQC